MRCINGLTDGYFDFLSFIEKAYRDDFPKLNPQQQKSFLAIYRAVYYAANRGLLKLSVLYWWYSLRHLIKRTK
ncbi:MAG: hypothetical protein HY399_04125 [Elusimicrobia bacterium]|nr:hypothetical protein [Elusimicrobiota bacterium]